MPNGAGLSSSAALVVGILKAARKVGDGAKVGGGAMENRDIAVLARRVENEFLGMPCGIMDQMAVAISTHGEALALNTKSLSYELVALPKDYAVAVVHSGVYRKLVEGRYKERKEECDVAKQLLGNDDLCLIPESDAERIESLPAPINRRARHCKTEHLRTLAAIGALRNQDVSTFGALMNESHLSMRDDFEISLPEIDSLVEDAQRLGAIGARLTGGGFGGCIVSYVGRSSLDEWRSKLLERHPNAFFVC